MNRVLPLLGASTAALVAVLGIMAAWKVFGFTSREIHAKPEAPVPIGNSPSTESKRSIFKTYRRVDSSRLASFLKAHSYSPDSIAVAFDLSGDAALLKRGLEQNPYDWGLLMRFGACGADEDRITASKRLMSQFPQTASTYYMAMRWVGNTSTTASEEYSLETWNRDTELLSRAVKVTDRPLIDSKNIILRQEAFTTLGLNHEDARTASAMHPDAELYLTVHQRGAVGAMIRAANLTADQDKRHQVLLDAAASCKHLAAKAKDSLMTMRSAIALKMDVLSRLDSGLEYGEDGKTVEDLLAESKRELADFPKLLSIDLEHISSENRQFYYENRLAVGEVQALRDLLPRIEPNRPKAAQAR